MNYPDYPDFGKPSKRYTRRSVNASVDVRSYLAHHRIHMGSDRVAVLLRRRSWRGVDGDMTRWGYSQESCEQIRPLLEAIGIMKVR